MRLIDADALMQSLGITNMDCDECSWQDKEWSRCKRGGDFEDACCAIEDAPTIEERKKGKWTQILNADKVTHDYRCSECHRFRFHNGEMLKKYKFCPNCGAEMRGEDDEAD